MNSITPAHAAPGSSSVGMIRSHMALTVAASESEKKRCDDSQTGGHWIRGAASRVAEDARRKARRVMSLRGDTGSIGSAWLGIKTRPQTLERSENLVWSRIR